MTSRPAPMCCFCKHSRPETVVKTPAGRRETCDAFPQGIPDAIFLEGFDHRMPFPGDGGIRFEAVDDKAVERIRRQYGE